MKRVGGSHELYSYEDDFLSLTVKDMLFNNWRYLLFEESVQGALDLGKIEIPPLEYVRIMFEISRHWPGVARSGLIGGLGSAALWHAVRAAFGATFKLTAVEIEPLILELAQRFFYLPAHAEVLVEDLRAALESGELGIRDRIWIDCYNAVMVPPHLMTADFLELVAAALSEEGVAIFNIWREDANPIWGHQYRTLLSVFPHVGALICRHDANMILVASRLAPELWPSLIRRDETTYSLRISSRELPRDWPPAVTAGEILRDATLSEQFERIGHAV